MQPFAVFAFAVILVGLAVTFVVIGQRIFVAKDEERNSPVDASGSVPEQPIVMTVSAILLLGLFVGSLFIGRQFIFPAMPNGATAEQAQPASNQNLSRGELKELANQVDKSADNVYNGLDKTKEIIGKTESRNQAIEQGRDRAQGKMKSLADRLRQASDNNESIPSVEIDRARHLTGDDVTPSS